MSSRLRVLSFHSVKGGVGKSTLATLAAIGIARRQPNAPVWLLDMDLTGTSLGDALPLQAPRWTGGIDLRCEPDNYYSVDETSTRIERRGAQPGQTGEVPYFNDYLLYADAQWEDDQDAIPEAIAWRLNGGPDNLRVVPSSALPPDLDQTLPVIFDEEHAAFLEARLELLLADLVPDKGDTWVIFDVPPTIPGLSRAVLSLGLRLGRAPEHRVPLATLDPVIPRPLDRVGIDWRAHLVSTMDLQDLRAAARWARLVQPGDFVRVRAVFNGLSDSEVHYQESAWDDHLDEALGPASVIPQLWEWRQEPVRIADSPDLRVFRGDSALVRSEAVQDLLKQLLTGSFSIAETPG